MVGNLSSSQNITFSPQDIPKDIPNHNDPLHLEFFIHNAKVRHVLIDGGARLNIYTLKVVKGLGYSKEDVDPSHKITIKAYDDGGCFSKSVIILPILMGPAMENTLFQVLDIDMNYKMILGHPWTHATKAIPSTYHQCLNLTYNNMEVTIPGDPDLFQFCANLRDATAYQVPIKNEVQPINSSKYVDLDILLGKAKEEMEIEDKGYGEYFMSKIFHIRESPLSTLYCGKSQLLQAQQPKINTQSATSINFISGGGLHEEHVSQNTSICIEKKKKEQESSLISPSNYGPRFTIMQK